MAYLTCPDCRMPNPVADDAVTYRCFSCFANVVFESCGECGFRQAIPSRWEAAFSCGRCGERVPIPRFRTYSSSTRAVSVQGYGYLWPRV
jgi:hypothetical protein